MRPGRLAAGIAALAMGCGHGAAPTAAPAPVAADAPTAAPAWDVPTGWRTETIPFPLEFAPTLPYRGVEELRFPPGFLTAGDARFFSYAFVWYLAAPGPGDADVLERDLVGYFRGLAQAVGGAGRVDIAAATFAAALEGSVAPGGRAEGTVDAFDAFTTQAAVRLHLRIASVACAAPGRVALVVSASPHVPGASGPGAAVWAELDALVAGFRC